MNFTPLQERFMRSYLDAIQNGKAAIFAGAGLSIDSGLVDWKTLLTPLAEHLGLSIDRERDLVSLAQFYVNERQQNRHEINKLILNHIGVNAKPNRKHRALARLPINTYWTINYDRLIENALRDEEKLVDVRYRVQDLNVTRTRRDAVLYKMHGDVEQPDGAVIIRDDYEGYHLNRSLFISTLIGDLLDKQFLFLGLSFEDPNVNFVLGRIRSQLTAAGGGEHFCIMRTEKPKEDEEAEDFRFRELRQKLLASDLLRFNITVVFVEEYEHIDLILEEIERRYRRGTILISGSAATTGAWSRDDVEAFVIGLTSALVDRGCRLVTGFGKGIGRYVVTGALTTIYRKKLEQDRHLVIRPFPHAGNDSADTIALKETHRQAFIPLAGIALFLFGNRELDGQVVNSPGVRREFEIAVEHHLTPLPVGGTGSVSAELHGEVMADFARHYPEHTERLRPLVDALGQQQDSLDSYIQPIIDIIQILRGAR